MLSNLPWVTQRDRLPGAQAKLRWQLAGASSHRLPQIGVSLNGTSSCTVPTPMGQMGSVKYVLTSVPTTTASYFQVDFSVSTRGSQEGWGHTSLLLPGQVVVPGLWRVERPTMGVLRHGSIAHFLLST